MAKRMTASKRGRKPKSAVIEADEPQNDSLIEQESIVVPSEPAIDAIDPEPERESLELDPDDVPEPVSAVVVPDLPGVSLFDEPAVPAPVPLDDIPSPDEGLTPAQKLEFVRLVRQEMPLAERAKQLAVLARMKTSKTAAVGLRAIQEMNKLDGFTDDAASEMPPMFNLPDGTQVAVAVKVPSK